MEANHKAIVVNGVEQHAGMFVTAQLGNPSDTYWAPKAVLLLAKKHTINGYTTFLALGKKDDGTAQLYRYVAPFHKPEMYRPLPVADFYCTSSLNETKFSACLSARELEIAEAVVAMYQEELAAMEPIVYIPGIRR